MSLPEGRYDLIDSHEKSNETVDALFDSSPAFRKVLAGGMTLQTFVDKYPNDYQRLSNIAQQTFPNMSTLKHITQEGVVCAWVAKLRFNQDMDNHDFFTHVKNADAIFSGDKTELNLKGTPHTENDNISIMWGIQALAGKEGFDNGVTRIRLPEGVAPVIYNKLKIGGAKERTSTHAYLTSIDDKGIGKDLEDEQMRKYTPMGYGTLLTYRTFQSDGDAKAHAQNKENMPNDHDLFFKMEDFGFLDKLSHTLLHVLGPLKAPFVGLVSEGLFHKKSGLARAAEKEEGTFKKISRKDHLSALGAENANHLVKILEAVQNDPSDNPAKEAFKDYKMVNAFRVKLPWPFEKKIVGNGQQMSLASFVNKISEQSQYIESLGFKTELDKLSQLRDVCQGEVSNRREGFEVIVDASNKDHQADVKSVGNLLKEPKLKVSMMDKITRLFEAVTSFAGFGTNHVKIAPEVSQTNAPLGQSSTNEFSLGDGVSSRQSLPVVPKVVKAPLVQLEIGNVLEKVAIPLMSMINAESENGHMQSDDAQKLSNALQAVVSYPRTKDNESQYVEQVSLYRQVVDELTQKGGITPSLNDHISRVLNIMDLPIESQTQAVVKDEEPKSASLYTPN